MSWASPPSENKSSITKLQIARFKFTVSRRWILIPDELVLAMTGKGILWPEFFCHVKK
jgi:hypothetical protein